jgi:hypothetical protein
VGPARRATPRTKKERWAQSRGNVVSGQRKKQCYTLSQPQVQAASLGLVYTRDQFEAALVGTKMGIPLPLLQPR